MQLSSVCDYRKFLKSHPVLQEIWRALPDARLVGGTVRDLITGRTPKDLDMAAPYPPERITEILTGAGLSYVPTGLSHGTVTVLACGESVELTALRKDVETDGRHAKVEWTRSWEEDAARRDFTINALSADSHGRIYDYFDGLADLEAGRVRFVGESARRIEEDALRILRFFRFYARFDRHAPDREAVEAIKARTDLIGLLSAERIANELSGILSGPRAFEIVDYMSAYGVAETIFPNPDIGRLRYLTDLLPESSHRVKLYALYGDSAIGNRLKLSNADKSALKSLERFLAQNTEPFSGEDTDALRRALYAFDKETVLAGNALLMRGEMKPFERLKESVESLETPQFPIMGKDLLALGVPKGASMGRVLKQVRQWWLDGGCKADRKSCLEYAKTTLSDGMQA